MIFLVLLLLIFDFILAISVFNLYKKINNKTEKPTKKLKNIDYKEYIYSMKFNTKLDQLIIPLLDKNSNEDIIIKIMNLLYDNDENVQQIPKSELKSHIENTLSYYPNKYIENIEEKEVVESIDKQIFVDSPRSDNEINLSNTLNNFYND